MPREGVKKILTGMSVNHRSPHPILVLRTKVGAFKGGGGVATGKGGHGHLLFCLFYVSEYSA